MEDRSILVVGYFSFAIYFAVMVSRDFYLEQFVHTANGATAFAAIQGVAFTVSILSSGELWTRLEKLRHPEWIYVEIGLGVLVYWTIVIGCWRAEVGFLKENGDALLRQSALRLLLGRLLIIVLANLPLLLVVNGIFSPQA